MSGTQRMSRLPRFLGLVAQFLAIAVLWLAIVAIATACFFPPAAAFPPTTDAGWAQLDNALIFASSTAIAVALAVATAFALGGDWRRGLHVLVTVLVLFGLFAAAAATCFWLAPWIGRNWMGYWEFVRFRQRLLLMASSTVRYNLPLAAFVSLIAGTVAGLLGITARRSPSLALALVVGLLLAGATGSVQQLVLGVVLNCGLIVRWWIASPGMTDPLVPASGAVSGAIAGIVVAVAMMWRARGRGPVADRIWARRRRPAGSPILSQRKP